ncbi:MAG: ATP-binding protein [Thermodesulfovibrionales bacterium]
MQQINLLRYYLLGRVIFAVALQISFQFAADHFSINKVSVVIGVYGFIALLRLIYNPERCHPLDFILDICFVSGIVYASFYYHSYSYLTLLYLFPIFFASLSINDKKAYIIPFLCAFLYSVVYSLSGLLFEKTSIINIGLHGFAFILIFYAGRQLSIKISNQESLIKKLEEERIRTQGYERLFRVSADLAHELRNPLASISAAVQFIKEGKDANNFIQMLDEEINKISRIIKEFLMFSRPSDAPKELINLSVLIKQVLAHNPKGDISVSLRLDDNINLMANRTFMEIAFGNVIKNAFESGASLVEISSQKVRSGIFKNIHQSGAKKNSDFILIDVEDNGRGVSDDLKERIFEPFVTTKPNGTGLGLAIAYRVITDLGGNISIERSRLGGAMFRILLPVSD